MKKLVLLSMALVYIAINTSKAQVSDFWYFRGGLNLYKGAIMESENNGAFVETKYSTANKKSSAGYNLTIGFQKPLGVLFWGMEFGLGTRGYKYEENLGVDGTYTEKLMAHNIQFSPFTFGYRYDISDAIGLEAHFGPFLSFDYLGKGKEEYSKYPEDNLEYSIWKKEITEGDKYQTYSYNPWDDGYKHFDIGTTWGVGVWFNQRLGVDFSLQNSFMAIRKYTENEYNETYEEKYVSKTSVMLRFQYVLY